MLSLINRRPTRRLVATAVAAALSFTLATALLDGTAPTRSSSAAQPSVTSICDQSLALVSASFTVPSSAVAGPTVDSVAAKAPAAQQAAYLASVKQKAAASCEKQLKVQQAVWGYLPARAVEIAIDATITVLTATAVCYFAPTACTWGVRVGAFVGGFMGSFAFQYLTDGTVDWKTAGYALLDAAVSMFTFAGLDSLAE